MPLCAFGPGCTAIASFAGAPGFAVAWNVTFGPFCIDASNVCGPETEPSVHEVSVATPCAFVLTGVDGNTVPLPDGVNVIATLGTGF